MTNPTSPSADTTHADTDTLVKMLAQALAERQSNPHSAAAEREADRWLYEQLMNYRGMLYKRPLTRSIEFIVWAPSRFGPRPVDGWYYRAPAGPGGISPATGCAFNWYGPHPSHAAALEARDRDHPRRIAPATMQRLMKEEYLT